MPVRNAVLSVLLIFLLSAGLWSAGCRPAEQDIDVDVDEESEEEVVYERGEGVFVGQIDSQSVEIEVDGGHRAYGLAEGVQVSEIRSGSKVTFTYRETDTRPVLHAIEVIDTAEEILQGEGIYTGQIDSHSVEIEVEGEFRAFALSRQALVKDLIDGSRIAFTYREEEHRPVLLSVEVLEAPDKPEPDENAVMEGEGIYVGQIDSQSVEIQRSRAFSLGEGVSVSGIADGSRVAFTYIETEPRAVLASIEAVEVPPEGEIMHGIYVGQIDSNSVEIQYEQALALGEGVSVEGIADGSSVVFTYRPGPPRPVLVSVAIQ